MDFLHETQVEKGDSLEPSDFMLLKKIHGEAKKALDDRSDFKKENLIGFHSNY